ncbi:MAG: zinc ABC transporter solute-binding protein [Clostridiales bacterium]|nr:zinc ABC transporter solute-binding protein [Clostridiales bacterium]
MKRLFSATACLLIFFSFAFLSACARQSERNPAGGKPIIAVSIVPERTFVEAVCGDLVEVITMIPPGNSPENYEPAPELMEKFSDAEVYFAIGVPTEQANILPSAGDVAVVSLHDEVESIYPERTFAEGERDPHIWLSPKRVKVMIDIIAREMAKIDPNNADTYHLNAKAYIKQLDELDKQIIDALSGLTVRKFVVYHPAFGYLADDYGLEMFALEEEGKEATPQHLQSMIDLAKEENIKIIFYQEEIDSSQSKAFAEELGGTTVKLAPLAADYIDNLRRMAEALAEGIQ